MNQFSTGGFGHRGFASDIIGGKGWQGWNARFGSENPGCCSIWGQWALGMAGRHIVATANEAVDVNLHPCTDAELPGGNLRLLLRSDFPLSRAVTVRVSCDRPSRFPLRLRVPAWVNDAAVTLNGAAAGVQRQGSRLIVEREWHPGDRVDVAFQGGVRLVFSPAGAKDRAALFDGPLCLGLSSAGGDVEACDRVLVDAQGNLVLGPDGIPRAISQDGASAALAPVARDWRSPDVRNPRRIRVLFTVTRR